MQHTCQLFNLFLIVLVLPVLFGLKQQLQLQFHKHLHGYLQCFDKVALCTLSYTVKYIFYLRKFSFPMKGPVNSSTTLDKAKLKCSKISRFKEHEVEMQPKYNVLQ